MLKKLSLAALVALGSVSVASATPLTEAIKNVDLNGYLRLRYYHENLKENNEADLDADSFNYWRTNAKLVFSVPVAENMKFVWRVHSQTKIYEKATRNDGNDKKTTVTDSLFFLNYANNGLVVNAGVVPLGALPFASSDSFTTAHGPGVVALYNVGNGLTLAGGWADKIYNVDSLGDALNNLNGTADLANTVDALYGLSSLSNDVYTIGAIYGNEYGKGQLWWYKATNLIDNAVVLMTDLNILKDYGIGVKFDYAQSELNADGVFNVVKAASPVAAGAIGTSSDLKVGTHRFYNIALTANVMGFDGMLGYASTNKKAGIIATSNDSAIGHVPAVLRYNVANELNADTIYAKAGYKINDATNLYVSYVDIDEKDCGTPNDGINYRAKDKDIDSTEIDLGGSYAVNKKLTFSGYFASLNYKSNAEKQGYQDQQEVKVEALYKF